jgi:hypothetical protein
MTRTHVDEGELVELGRKALALLTRLDDFGGRLEELREDSCIPKQTDLDDIERITNLAREVSDQVDALTEYVRYQQEQPQACGKWDCPE